MVIDRVQVLVLCCKPVTTPIVMAAASGVTGTIGVTALVFQPIDLTTVLIALGMLITAVGTAYTAIHTGRIEGHVDGMATAAAAKHTADTDMIASLRQQLSDSEKRAALLAQAKTNVDIATAIPTITP